VRYYEPESLPLDVLGVTRAGIGRGGGTRIVDRYSLLEDNDVTPKIVKRVFTRASCVWTTMGDETLTIRISLF
jgi:hypothetical protein